MGYPIDAMCAMCDKTDEYLTMSLCPACHEEVEAREEVQRSASKIIESLERWPEDEERLDSYWEDHEYG